MRDYSHPGSRLYERLAVLEYGYWLMSKLGNLESHKLIIDICRLWVLLQRPPVMRSLV